MVVVVGCEGMERAAIISGLVQSLPSRHDGAILMWVRTLTCILNSRAALCLFFGFPFPGGPPLGGAPDTIGGGIPPPSSLSGDLSELFEGDLAPPLLVGGVEGGGIFVKLSLDFFLRGGGPRGGPGMMPALVIAGVRGNLKNGVMGLIFSWEWGRGRGEGGGEGVREKWEYSTGVGSLHVQSAEKKTNVAGKFVNINIHDS